MSLLSLSKKIIKREKASEKKPKKAAAKKKAPAKKTAKKEDKKKALDVSVLAGRIGMQPILSEKSILLQGQNTLVIRVKPHVTKYQIMQAITEEFGQKPISVRTANMNPKTRRRGMTVGRTPHWKKAYVKVEDIQSLIAGA